MIMVPYILLAVVFLAMLGWTLKLVNSPEAGLIDPSSEAKIELANYLSKQSREKQKQFRKLQFINELASGILLFSVLIFLIAGMGSEISPIEVRHTISDPLTLIAFFGWSLFGLSLALSNISLGLIGIRVGGIIRMRWILIIKPKFIQGKYARNHGIMRLLIGIWAIIIVASLAVVPLIFP